MPEIRDLLQDDAERKKYKRPLEVVAAANKVCTSLMLRSPPRRPRAPWLVFFGHGKQRTLHTFVSLSEERVYVREVQEMSRACYYAQYGSWLFMTDLSHTTGFLLNLSSKKKMTLPPLPRGYLDVLDTMITSPPCLKAAAGAAKAGGGRPALMILSYQFDLKAFLYHRMFEKGVSKWEMAKCRQEIKCLVRCKGTIYALGGLRDDLVAVDIDDVSGRPKVRTLHTDAVAFPLGTRCRSQLLESCGELFRVAMHFVRFTKRFYSFTVHRLDSSNMKWVEVSGLGDRAFFFGTSIFGGSGVSYSASAAGIAANCVYFLDRADYSTILKFDMADKSVSSEMSWPLVSDQPWSGVTWIKHVDHLFEQ